MKHLREDQYLSTEAFQEPQGAKGFAYELTQVERFEDPSSWRGGERHEFGAEMPEDFLPRDIPAFVTDPNSLVAFGSRAEPQERKGPARDADNSRVPAPLKYPTAIHGPW